MKRILALILCFALLVLPGCGNDLGAYTPTGNGLTWDEEELPTETTEEIIKEKEEFIVNITSSPTMFTLSSTDTIPDEHLTRIANKTKSNDELAYISEADAYMICEVKSIKSSFRENNPIKDTGVNFIKAEVVELNANNKCVKPMNRAIHALIESLVNYSRINIVDEDKQKYFLERFRESERIIKRVGNEEEKESWLSVSYYFVIKSQK